MDDHTQIHRVRVAADGSVTLPLEFRRRVGIECGDEVLLKVEDDTIKLFTRHAALERAKNLTRAKVPEGVSLVDELIAERRREAENE